MLSVKDYEIMRRARFVENKSIREIAREYGHCRRTVRKALKYVEPPPFETGNRSAPILGAYRAQIETLLEENEKLPLKQRYTSRKIYEEIRKAGYSGSESGVRRYVGQLRKERRVRKSFLPLEFDAGEDAQMDWGEAVVDMAGKRRKVEFFVMRLNYSRARFAMAFPFQKQEAFLEGHVQAFIFFGGVPRRISYDNLKTAVLRILEGRKREEQENFIRLCSHYLFERRYCTPGKGHEKGGVESDVGYVRRNFLVPIPEVESFEELNRHLWEACLVDTKRKVRGKKPDVRELWIEEKAVLLPLPEQAYDPCVRRLATPNPYSQVVLDTNRYSIPTTTPATPLTLKAYAFRIEVLQAEKVIAKHPRCFEREQDILDPLHYLDLLQQRPGAFEHAKPLREWRAVWPPVYEQLLEELRRRWPEARGVREFIAILKLHQSHPTNLIEKAVHQALELGAVHQDGVALCLRQLLEPQIQPQQLDLSAHPDLAALGSQPIDLHKYDQLLGAENA